MRTRVHVLAAALACALGGSGLGACAVPEASTHVDDAARTTEPTPAAPVRDAQGTTDTKNPQDTGTMPRPKRDRRAAPARTGATVAALAKLTVKGRAPMTGYDRDEFGQAWLDTNRNGCDTRNDILAAHLTRIVIEPGTHGCVVTSGTLADEYTGPSIDFVRGDGFLVDIYHVVALGNAWSGGAARWEVRKRGAFANDPLNLLPADAGANRAKGDGDAATWLPPNRAFRCAYVARQVAVKAKYGLPVTLAEHGAIDRVLGTCPREPLPKDSGAPVVSPIDVNAPTRRPQQPTRKPSLKPSPRSPGSRPADAPVYENCDAARAAGAAPVQRGDPGYGSHLDRDGDGSACE